MREPTVRKIATINGEQLTNVFNITAVKHGECGSESPHA